MSENGPNRLDRAACALVGGCCRFPWLVLGAGLILTIAMAWFVVGNLRLNTDTGAMFSSDSAFHRQYQAYKKQFPQYEDTLVIVIDAPSAADARDASARLARTLEARTDLFSSVYHFGDDPFFDQAGLLYLTPDELNRLSSKLARVQPLLSRLVEKPSASRLLSILEQAFKIRSSGFAIDLTALTEPLCEAIGSTVDESAKPRPLPWRKLLGPSSEAGARRVIVTQPRLDFAKFQPGGGAMESVRTLAGELGIDEANAMRVRFTGPVAVSAEDMRSVRQGAVTATVVAMGLVCAFLWLAMRSRVMVLATLVALVMGLVWTSAFAAAAVGRLNMLTVAFGAMYVGLGVDYAIHLCLAYRDRAGSSLGGDQALRAAGGDVASSLALCASTTAIGFFAFWPTSLAGVAQLGLITGMGVFIGLTLTFTILPAMLTVLPHRTMPVYGHHLGGVPEASVRHARFVRRAAILIAIIASPAALMIRFDYNPMNLRDEASEAITTMNDLVADGWTDPFPMVVLTPPSNGAAGESDAARDLERRLEALPEVRRVGSIEDFVPADQPRKLRIIDEMSLILGPMLAGEVAPRRSATDNDSPEEIARLLRALARQLRRTNSPEDARLAAQIHALDSRLASAQETQRPAIVARLEENILSDLPAAIGQLRAALGAQRFSAMDLPADTRQRWIDDKGVRRLEVMPSEDIRNPDTLRRFVSSVRTIAPDATGAPVFFLEAGDAVVWSFVEAMLMATTAIFLLLVVLFRSARGAIIAIAPVLLAALITGALAALFDLRINFANVIALPLLMGVGIDGSIHLLHRALGMGDKLPDLLRTGTARGVVYSAVTTICGFGSLMFSSHRGMASLGVLLLIGMAVMLLCVLAIIPAAVAPHAPTDTPPGDTPGDDNHRP